MADAYNRAMGRVTPRSLLDTLTVIPGAGDLLSGVLGAYDTGKGLLNDFSAAQEKDPRKMIKGMTQSTGDYVSGAANLASVLPFVTPALLGHTVWHGSPHKFDKFDMSKIGTGEGAQAYGHGLYFAEAPEIASYYSKNVVPPGPKREATIKNRVAQEYLDSFNGDANAAIKSIQDDIASGGYDNKRLKPALKVLQTGKQLNGYTPLMYKVDIPDEILPRMLDWDKPLSQQAPEVQAAMATVIEKKNPRLSQYLKESAGLDEAGQAAVRKRLGINIFDTVDTGGAAYQAAGQGNIESLLKAQGIPGIRYLDGKSRGTGGTSNYVLFDDRLPRILERNGVPTGQVPWKDDPEALRGLLGL